MVKKGEEELNVMKSILIFSHGMEIGGAEKALLGLLEAVDTSKYQVDLFLMRHTGELYQYIPKGIHVLDEKPEYASLAVPIIKVLKKGQFSIAWKRFLGKKNALKRVKELGLPVDNDVALEYSHKYTLKVMPNINEKEYDLAISFLTPHYFVAEKVCAKKKIAWIHTDYSKVAVDKESQLKMWNAYDIIASISEDVTKSFLRCFPELERKIQLLPNIMPINYIKKMAEEFSVKEEMRDDGAIKLLSIGRFCLAKNFDNVPWICKYLLNVGINVKWYLIGFGDSEELIRKQIIEADATENVIILGKKENPYPYIKECDIYIQPSRYEGKSVSVIEAQILHKPVIITNYATSKSQLEDGIDGMIVPMDNKECAKGIGKILKDEELLNTLIKNTIKREYVDFGGIQKLYRIMGEK